MINSLVVRASSYFSWLNLDLGIEVCLFDGLDGYWNTWLQFAFPAYLFLLMGGINVGQINALGTNKSESIVVGTSQ